MNLKEFVESKEFSSGSGLPEGDTMLDISKVQVEEIKNDEGKISFKLTLVDSSVRFVPKTVMKRIKELAPRFERVRVTRSGLTMNDTTYTVVGVGNA